MDIKGFIQMITVVCDRIIENEIKLCELDGFVGDGDHGVTVARGFRAVRQQLQSAPASSLELCCEEIGETLATTMGGAIGPIFGSIFTDGAEALGGCEEIDTPTMAAMLATGLEGVMLLGGAKPGDRTLVDALHPAVEAMSVAAKAAVPLSTALTMAAQAAEDGVKATCNMVAKKGRARFLGEKSKGHQDAGATSMSIVIRAMADACILLPPE